MMTSKRRTKKDLIAMLENTFRHVEETRELKQDDPLLLEIKGQIVRSITALDDSNGRIESRNRSQRRVA